MSTPVFNQIIRELCAELDIRYTELSDGWIFRLEKNSITHFISGNCFDLNSSASSAIASDKVSTYELLKSASIPAVPHYLIYNPDFIHKKLSPALESRISLLLDKFSFPLVIKPTHGSRGRDVYLCHTRSEAERHIYSLLRTDESVCLSPYFPAEFEYRCFFLDGEILLIYQKSRNRGSFRHNLSHGASPVILDSSSELYDDLVSLAVNAGRALGLRFATIDILSAKENSDDPCYSPILSAEENSEKPNTSDIKVLEVNSGVTTTIFAKKAENGYVLAKNIYREALKHLFYL